MRRSRIVASVVMLLIGIVWIGQGSGMVAGGAMSGSSFWAAGGVAFVIGAVVIGVRELARRSVSPRQGP